MKNSNYRYFVEAKEKGVDKFLNLDGFADEFENFDDELLNADAGTPAQKAVTSQPYIINIENLTTADVSNVKVMGANQNLPLSASNFGNPDSIEITMGMSNISYGEFLFQTTTYVFTAAMTYLQSSSQSQLLQTFILQHKESNGNLAQKVITPTFDPYQQLSTVIPVKTIYSVDGNTMFIWNKMLASQSLLIQIYPSNVIKIRRGLANMPVEQAYSNPGIVKAQTVKLDAAATNALRS